MRLRERTNGVSARIADIVLRVIPKNTADALRWITRGYDDEDDEQEVFHGAGFAARPASGSNAEALAVAVNGFDHHVIVATRDADTLRRVIDALGLDAGEAIVFSTGTAVKCTDTRIVAKSLEGLAQFLALKTDVDAIWDYLAMQFHPLTGHKHTVSGTTTTAVAPSVVPGVPVGASVGTTVFQAE